MKSFVLLIILYVVFACNLSDYSKTVGPGCTYVHESIIDQFILCSSEFSFYPAEPLVYHHGNDTLYPFGGIPPNINSFDYNAEWLILEQSPHNPLSKNTCTDVMDSIRNYWVIDFEKKIVYGPLDFDEFKAKKDSLGIIDLTIEINKSILIEGCD